MLNLAWRNIWRKRWRSVFTVLAVGLVVFLSIINFGLSTAMKNAMYEGITSSGGHLQIHVEDYRDKRDFSDLLLRDANKVKEGVLKAIPEAKVTSSLQVAGLLEGNNQRSRGVMLVGIEQPEELKQDFLDDYVVEGGEFPASDNVENIALGEKLAKSLKVDIGDVVYMYTFNTEGYGAAAYTVSGFLSLPGSEALAYISLLAAQELAAPEAVSQIEVHLGNLKTFETDELLPETKSKITAVLDKNSNVETWAEITPGMRSYLDLFDPINLVFTAIFFILAGLVVTNTIYLSIIERVREFGVMMAMGLKRIKVITMVLFESLWLCGVGTFLGAIFGAWAVWRMSKGFSFPGFDEMFADMGLDNFFYATLSSNDVIFTVCFVFLTGILAALLPAITAGKLQPVEAMRFTV